MLPDHIRLKNINHITYNVKSKDAALQWYRDVLGLGLIPKMVNSEHLYWLAAAQRRHGSYHRESRRAFCAFPPHGL